MACIQVLNICQVHCSHKCYFYTRIQEFNDNSHGVNTCVLFILNSILEKKSLCTSILNKISSVIFYKCQ